MTEIIVGGIYEILPDSGITDEYQTVKVVMGRDRAEQPMIDYRVYSKGWSKCYPLDVKHFGRQIGFDVTQTHEYEEVKAELARRQDLVKCCEKLMAEIEKGAKHSLSKQIYKSIDLYKSELELGVTGAQNALEDMESQSWMETDQ